MIIFRHFQPFSGIFSHFQPFSAIFIHFYKTTFYNSILNTWITREARGFSLTSNSNTFAKQADRSTKKYQVTVTTSGQKGAGTDANVQLNIFGELGDSGARKLKQSWRDLFEQNQVDNFELDILDLGELKKCVLEHDNSGFGADWLCDRVDVKDVVTGKSWSFPCRQWIGKKKAGTLSRELFPDN